MDTENNNTAPDPPATSDQDMSEMLYANRWQGWRGVLAISWPLILANSFWNIQMTIDRIFVGNYSTDALGAAMGVNGVYWTPMALLQQTAAYSMTFVAQYYGAKKLAQIGPSIWQAIYISILGGLLFLLLYPLSPAIFKLIGHSENMQALEVVYFQALCFSAMPVAILAALSGFYTGLGASRMVMWINVVGMLSNIVLDYLLVFGNLGFPAMGIAGAGYATVGANWAAVAYACYRVFSRKHEAEYKILSACKPNLDLLKRYLRFGMPAGLQWALEGLAFTVFLIFVGRMENGDAALAGSGIAVTLMMLSILPALGVGQGVSVLVGQHLGEDKPTHAEHAVWRGVEIAAIYMFSVGVSFLIFPNFYINWFHNADNAARWEEVASMVPYLLMFVAVFTVFDSLNMVFSFALRGAGDTRFVTLIALTVPWPLMVGPTWLMVSWEGAIYWAWGAASLFIMAQACIFLWRFMQGHWKNMRVI